MSTCSNSTGSPSIDDDLDDASALGCPDLVHQLHRLDDADRLAGVDHVALDHERLGSGLLGAVERTHERRQHRHRVSVASVIAANEPDADLARRRDPEAGARAGHERARKHARLATVCGSAPPATPTLDLDDAVTGRHATALSTLLPSSRPIRSRASAQTD